MPKQLHIFEICNDKIKKKAYMWELGSGWMHAKCLFPNAGGTKLKILYEYNTSFDVSILETYSSKWSTGSTWSAWSLVSVVG